MRFFNDAFIIFLGFFLNLFFFFFYPLGIFDVIRYSGTNLINQLIQFIRADNDLVILHKGTFAAFDGAFQLV